MPGSISTTMSLRPVLGPEQELGVRMNQVPLYSGSMSSRTFSCRVVEGQGTHLADVDAGGHGSLALARGHRLAVSISTLIGRVPGQPGSRSSAAWLERMKSSTASASTINPVILKSRSGLDRALHG